MICIKDLGIEVITFEVPLGQVAECSRHLRLPRKTPISVSNTQFSVSSQHTLICTFRVASHARKRIVSFSPERSFPVKVARWKGRT